MIDFTRAFDSAWERVMVILFRPFDLGKWFVIGFSAFLAGFLQGGNGVNGFHSNNFSPKTFSRNSSGLTTPWGGTDLHAFNSKLQHALAGMQVGFAIGIVLVFTVVFCAVLLVFYWLGARGQFLFLDNLVRNRGAVSWPWQFYGRQANSLFGFYALVMAISFVIMLPFVIIGIVMGLPLVREQRWPEGGEIAAFVLLGAAYFVFAFVIALLLFLFRELGVPLMFRNGLMARDALVETLNLVKLHPGSIVLFLLLRFVLAIGGAILALIICCGTCCIGLLPYLGTVALLPVLVYVRCFTLDCLAQFGPQYDVWTVDVPPVATEPPPSIPPGAGLPPQDIPPVSGPGPFSPPPPPG